jgi:uncharacterized cupredoxin-like copper-binding protein
MVPKDLVAGSIARRGVVAAAAAILLVGCSAAAPASSSPAPSQGGAVAAGTPVTAALSEFKIELGGASTAAGPVTFQLTNKGAVVHEFVVFKTDLAADQLPMSADGATVDEAGGGGALTLVDEVEDIAVGAAPTLAVNLPAGHYVVICNVEAHYKAGMHAPFTTN